MRSWLAFLLLFGLSSAHAQVCTRLRVSRCPLGITKLTEGAIFRVWAPQATQVVVRGDFQNHAATLLVREGGSDIFSGFIHSVQVGDAYHYELTTPQGLLTLLDPQGREVRVDGSANLIVDPKAYHWQSQNFEPAPLNKAVIYELHVGSFNSVVGGWGSYSSVQAKLDDLKALGVNYLELMPLQLSARPRDWGYGVSLPDTLEPSYGSGDDLRRLVDQAHLRGIAILVDVVHNHYSRGSALVNWDGGGVGDFGSFFYPDGNVVTPWGPRPNFSLQPVRDLIADSVDRLRLEYHIDGARWDALPYITKFISTRSGKSKDEPLNPDGISLIQAITSGAITSGAITSEAITSGAITSGAITSRAKGKFINIAEDFENDSAITKDVSAGGWGFNAHWTGLFPVVDAITAPHPENLQLNAVVGALQGSTDRVIFTESHDEVGHPPRQIRIPTRIDAAHPGSLQAKKRSLLGAVMIMTAPGVPMIFQGQEFLESADFIFPTGTPLDWQKAETFAGIETAYSDLIHLRRGDRPETLALSGPGIDIYHINDGPKVIAYRRWLNSTPQQVVALVNLGEESFTSYRIGLPHRGPWKIAFTSDDATYASEFGNHPRVRSASAEGIPYDGQPFSMSFELPAVTALILTE